MSISRLTLAIVAIGAVFGTLPAMAHTHHHARPMHSRVHLVAATTEATPVKPVAPVAKPAAVTTSPGLPTTSSVTAVPSAKLPRAALPSIAPKL